MKYLPILLVLGCRQQSEQLSPDEIAQNKIYIIKRSEKHASDLVNLYNKSAMTFYAKTPDFIFLGDGYYWGNYLTVDGFGKIFLKSMVGERS